LTLNPNAIHILEKNLDKLDEESMTGRDWDYLSRNPNAIHILENNLNKIDWFSLSINPNIFYP
jgi:hypothetical protein